MINIKYGTDNNKIDITKIVQDKFTLNGITEISNIDHVRSFHFGDPEYGIVKNIFYNNNKIENKNQNIKLYIKKKIYIYFFICCINNYLKITNYIYNYIKNSSIYDSITEIRCVITNSKNDKDLKNFYKYEKIKIIHKEYENLGNNSEYIILNLLKKDSSLDNFYVLYLHTKGVSERHQNIVMQKNISSWINYLLYFNIDCFETIYKNLDNYDAISTNLIGNNSNIFNNNYNNINELIEKEGWCGPSWPYIFSGNFWWSKSSYIKDISNCKKEYPSAEFWITCGKNGKFLSLFNVNHNFYESEYEEHKYKNKELMLYEKINY